MRILSSSTRSHGEAYIPQAAQSTTCVVGDGTVKPVMLLHRRCPYCSQVKQLFQKLDVPAKIVELDSVVEGDDVQVSSCNVLHPV